MSTKKLGMDGHIQERAQSHKTYLGRYYILVVFSMFAAHQNVAWMTFGTIPLESFQAFRLSDDTITILAAYGPIAFIPLMFPFIWFLDRFGLKVSMLVAVWVLAIGVGIRCAIPNGSQWTFVLHIGHFLIGAAGPPVMIMPPRISSVWFPPKQRTFATAVTTTAQGFGVSLAFIINPYITRHYDIHTMLYIHAELALCIAILATIYFPAQPPTPPSFTAKQERMKFLASLKALLCNPSFILVVLSGGLVSGGNSGFSSVLSIVLNPSSGFSDEISVTSVNGFFHSNAWLGAFSSMSSVLGGVVAGLVADRIQRRLKLILLILLIVSTVLAFWFAVSVYGYTSDNAVNLFITLCLNYFFAFATGPLYYEAAVELTYPVPEGSSAGILTVLTNIGAIILQVIALCHIFSNDHPEKARAMVWVLGGLTLASCITILFFKEKYGRLNEDTDTVAQKRLITE